MSAIGERRAAVEFLVEPFAEGSPGDHVHAAVEAFESRGLEVELGPFSSLAIGDPVELAGAMSDMVLAAMDAGATAIRMHVGVEGDALSVGTLHDALDGMIRVAERAVGLPSGEWSRTEKQAVVRMLHEQGAFLLRGAVDDIAAVMGVSRITIYNYLNAIEPGDRDTDATPD